MAGLVLAAVLETALMGAGAKGDLEDAFRWSATTNRPVVILLGATWCPGCVKMKNEILPAVARAGGLKDVAFIYVDVDQQPELARQLLRGQSIPQLVRFTPTRSGWNREYLVGAQQPAKVADFIAGQPETNVRFSSWLQPLGVGK